MVDNNLVDVSQNFTEDKINANLNDFRYNGSRGETTLQETAGKSVLGWNSDIWDFTGDTPKLKWESEIVVE